MARAVRKHPRAVAKTWFGGPDVPNNRRAPASACDDEDGVEGLSTFRPRLLDAAAWPSVEPFVNSAVGRLNLSRSPSAIRTVRVIARLVEWAVGEGIPLDPEVLLDPDTVERFIDVGLPNDRSRATYRSVLRRVGPLLTERAPWEPRPTSLARRQVAPPYADREIEQLRRDALRQPTDHRRRVARALLALGLGAGLDGRWVTRVVARDVEQRPGVVVRVGEPSSRVVPVLGSWEDEVLDLAATAGDEFLVGGRSISRNRASSLTGCLVFPPGHPRLSASRLRSTWLLWHLTAGTRLPELAAAAGLQGVTVLSDLLACVTPMPAVEAEAMLRGASR